MVLTRSGVYQTLPISVCWTSPYLFASLLDKEVLSLHDAESYIFLNSFHDLCKSGLNRSLLNPDFLVACSELVLCTV